MFGDFLKKLGILLQQVVISFFCIVADQRKNALLQCNIAGIGFFLKKCSILCISEHNFSRFS